ncbi:MAG TPA: DUF501 domain-containing protein [Ornithinimicrobium sp.]|uniref:DUF501 domain-containing protein n=1 Tax=Ornithinimicrobium sp. TaxID=1977084 RepID=UPI002B45CEF5|nr:DUF501 domain-containing protein [Ornithinimicrobium sp.]HKJ13091.1 DUF501 domain-containing protein [Ornithinimicrobium sp.]
MPPETRLRRDLETVRVQLGRPPRGVVDIAYRCPCGCPAVVRTRPTLPDGTPFPTLFYATCPALTAAVSRLESEGMMAEMTQRLRNDPSGPLARAYHSAHEDYLRRRAELGTPARLAGVSAGGMPTRVKCLHVLVAHSLATGPGVNPLGDEAVAALGSWWSDSCCAARLTGDVDDEGAGS